VSGFFESFNTMGSKRTTDPQVEPTRKSFRQSDRQLRPFSAFPHQNRRITRKNRQPRRRLWRRTGGRPAGSGKKIKRLLSFSRVAYLDLGKVGRPTAEQFSRVVLGCPCLARAARLTGQGRAGRRKTALRLAWSARINRSCRRSLVIGGGRTWAII
jgi:hypothetical protein